MGITSIVVVLLIIVGLLVVPIIPTESCNDTTKSIEVFGYEVGSTIDTKCSQTYTSVIGIFLKGLK